jgi:excinuclease ABC subunit C
MNSSDSAALFDAKAFLKTVTQRPGIYRLLDETGAIIYVGKARNLKRRLASHFAQQDSSPKQRAMMARVRNVEVTVTHTEQEALLLENQVIKTHKPRYNINLRDDKSYPYIYVATSHEYPRITFRRGAKPREGRYFGPFAGAAAVRDSLKLLQKVFRVRQCEDSFFQNRSRPCLQYQIHRCSAPCVGFVARECYQQDVQDTVMFLEGHGDQLIGDLVRRMEEAAEQRQFEKAARFRDQIASLRTVLAKQAVQGEHGDLDIVACACQGHLTCIQLFFIRKGLQIGERTFFPQTPDEYEPSKIVEAFLPQYYLGRPVPREVLLSHDITDRALLAEVLSKQAGHPVDITARVRGERLRRLQLAITNAESLLHSRLSERTDLRERFYDLARVMGQSDLPQRLECFDISHTQGDQAVASCVVFNQEGPLKSAYRRFNITGITPGDDYAALVQAVRRRYRRSKNGEHEAPDFLFIDGGKGQLRAVGDALRDLDMAGTRIYGIAKGPDRKPGMEILYDAAGKERMVPANSPARLLIQQIRDEAHRFALTAHRQRRNKAKMQSVLETVGGLGPKRRQTLLKHFGGLREISRAGIDALCTVQGINRALAERIYDTFHRQGT